MCRHVWKSLDLCVNTPQNSFAIAFHNRGPDQSMTLRSHPADQGTSGMQLRRSGRFSALVLIFLLIDLCPLCVYASDLFPAEPRASLVHLTHSRTHTLTHSVDQRRLHPSLVSSSQDHALMRCCSLRLCAVQFGCSGHERATEKNFAMLKLSK